MSRPSLFEMVHQVIAAQEEKLQKLASDGESVETKEEEEEKGEEEEQSSEEGEKPSEEEKKASFAGHLKIAAQCEFVASNFHLVEDHRTPQEKLAEYTAIHKALMKKAQESIPLTSALVDTEMYSGSPASSLPVEPNMTTGENQVDAGTTGEAIPADVPPQTTTPTEAPNPQDASNAMPTNEGMMFPAQPEEVLKQSSDRQALAILQRFAKRGFIGQEKVAAFKKKAEGASVDPGWWEAQKGMQRAQRASEHGLGKILAKDELVGKRIKGQFGGTVIGAGLGAGAGTLAGLALRGRTGLGTLGSAGLGALLGGSLGGVTGQVVGGTKADLDYLRSKGIDPRLLGLAGARFTPEAAEKYRVKQSSFQGVPTRFAKVFVKQAEDAIYPAVISAGTEPELQSIPGVPSSEMQGSEVFEQTPRETAPSSGQSGGRSLIESNESTINYTKRDAKNPEKGALGELLAEPAMSAAHDHVLQQSLDNASSAGVKISAARESQYKAARQLLKRAAASSPQARKQLDAMLKAAMAGEPIPAPGAELGGAADALATTPEVTDEALAAAADGVTTDQLAAAQQMLASQANEAAVAASQAATPEVGPGAAGEAPEMPAEGAAPVQA